MVETIEVLEERWCSIYWWWQKKNIKAIEESVVAVVKDIPDERDYEHCWSVRPEATQPPSPNPALVFNFLNYVINGLSDFVSPYWLKHQPKALVTMKRSAAKNPRRSYYRCWFWTKKIVGLMATHACPHACKSYLKNVDWSGESSKCDATIQWRCKSVLDSQHRAIWMQTGVWNLRMR